RSASSRRRPSGWSSTRSRRPTGTWRAIPARSERGVREARRRLPLHRGAGVASGGQVPALERHARRPHAALVGEGRRHDLPQAVQHVQRAHLRSPGAPARVRARQQPGDADGDRRAHRADRHPPPGQATQQPQRHRVQVGRRHLLQRPAVRPREVLRRRAPTRIVVPGRVPRGPRPEDDRAARGRLRSSQRPLLLTGRAAPLHQRHRAQAHPRVRRDAQGHAHQWPPVGRDQGRQARRPRRHEARLRRQRLLLRARRHPRVRSRRPAARDPRDAGAHRQLRLGRRRLPLAVRHRVDVALSHPPDDSGSSGLLIIKEASMHRRTLLVVLLAAALLVPPAADAQKPIKVGMPMPLSGPPALFGEPATKGAMMFVEEINARGGVLGRKLELITRDSKADANEAVRQARELILKDNVDFLVGTLTSAEGPAVSVVAKENKIAFIAAYSTPARAVGMFDALKYHFIGVGEAATPETAKSMGADYPVGIWGNSYDAFYWGETQTHRSYVARLSRYLKDEYPSSWAIQGYIGMQFLAEAIKKAESTDSDKVAKALLGLTVETPVGPLTIREKDHQANRGQLYGKTVMDPKYPFSIMKPVTYVDPTKSMD